MPYKRIKQGEPYVFQEFIFFSPQQFDEPVEIEDKKFIFRLKVCVNSGRCFTGPFIEDVIGEEEITKKEFNQLMEMVKDTPGIIFTGREYTIYNDYGGLEKYYG